MVKEFSVNQRLGHSAVQQQKIVLIWSGGESMEPENIMHNRWIWSIQLCVSRQTQIIQGKRSNRKFGK